MRRAVALPTTWGHREPLKAPVDAVDQPKFTEPWDLCEREVDTNYTGTQYVDLACEIFLCAEIIEACPDVLSWSLTKTRV